MRKKLLMLVLVLTLISSVAQALTVACPTQSVLKQADHITSLVMTGAIVAAIVLEKQGCKSLSALSLITFFAAAGANVVVSDLATFFTQIK